MLQIYRFEQNFRYIGKEEFTYQDRSLYLGFFSLVSDPQAYEQPDLDGDGARDLDPIGKLGNKQISDGFLLNRIVEVLV